MEILAILFIIILYFLPSLIASDRKHNDKSAILITNLFFGWSGLGWIICLIWANSGNVEGK